MQLSSSTLYAQSVVQQRTVHADEMQLELRAAHIALLMLAAQFALDIVLCTAAAPVVAAKHAVCFKYNIVLLH
jgi:hypothetical protein